jgi:hypothetical protein
MTTASSRANTNGAKNADMQTCGFPDAEGQLFLYGAGADCKSVAHRLKWFDSTAAHQMSHAPHSYRADLKPCPFCGGAPRLKNLPGLGVEISCENRDCPVCVSCDDSGTNAYEIAVGWWNTRHAGPSVPLELLEDCLAKIEAYSRELQGRYCGGVPNNILLPQLRSAIKRLGATPRGNE